ncbi:MAG: tetraacyldisaccharide 4'-kinase [Rickettsiales bacterium]|jgi:tetraacyldisaccharide 4'-kinase|nr:tetraacyldisaccharide 4'-kinase [Rickettsiales bacterium]
MQEPKYFFCRGLVSFALLPLSWIWTAADLARRRMARPHRPKARVICVGNAVLGGAGKTPIAIEIARTLLSLGKKVAVIMRGYRGRLNGPLIVRAEHAAADVGDEAKMISEILPGAIVAIGANRGDVARLVENRVDAIVMDDGLQNYTIAKDFSICVFDAKAGIGNGRVFPAGPLRQPLAAALRASDALVVMNGRLPRLPDAIEAQTEPDFDFAPYRGKKTVAFAGIGKPGKFFDMLAKNGVRLVKTKAFPDHHAYSERDIAGLFKDGLPVLTTQKDFVKLPPAARAKAVPVPIRVRGLDALLRKISALLKNI